MHVTRTWSGSPYEQTYGFCRALRTGDRIVVAGTAPIEADGSCPPGVEAQADRCFTIIVAAVEALGGSAADVVRTRMYIVDSTEADAVGRAHSRAFAGTPPAATMVVVAALLDPEWRVEIEAEAVVAAAG